MTQKQKSQSRRSSVYLGANAVAYLANRNFNCDGKINYSGGINAALELLAYLAQAEQPKISDADFVELCNVYAGSDLERLRYPFNLARDLLDHYGALDINALSSARKDLAIRLAALSQAQQFALLDRVRVFWVNA